MAFTNTNTALQNSVAFLQIQKNTNLKQSTAMGEDVFRIFRQTGRRIALIKQQVERERCTYLKDSYTEKNQLYKELAGIFHSKRAIHEKSRQLQGGESHSTVSFPAHSSRVSPTTGGTNNDSDRLLSSHKAQKELRSINVNVLKRCECCRRRAFRAVENEDDDDGVFDEEAFHEHCEGEHHTDKTQDKEKAKVIRKTSVSTKTGGSKKGSKQKAKLVQFSRYDDVRIPATQRVQAGMWALKRQTKGQKQGKQQKSVTFQVAGSTASLDNAEAKAPSVNEDKAASTTPGLCGASTRPTLRSRASMKQEYQTSKSNERVRLEGNAWTSHVENVQEKKQMNNSSKITGLSKAYCAFKKLLRQMEDEYVSEQWVEDEDSRAVSRAEVPGSRPTSNMSRTDSRWLPLRRSSVTLAIRLNTWTTGNLEPASMDSFKEKGEEGETTNLEEEDRVFKLEESS